MRPAARSLPPFKVAVRRRSASLAGLQNVRIHAQAHGTTRFAPFKSRITENLIESFFLCGGLLGKLALSPASSMTWRKGDF